jgi:hypothetical protein
MKQNVSTLERSQDEAIPWITSYQPYFRSTHEESHKDGNGSEIFIYHKCNWLPQIISRACRWFIAVLGFFLEIINIDWQNLLFHELCTNSPQFG